MEPYRNYGRGSYGRNVNSGGRSQCDMNTNYGTNRNSGCGCNTSPVKNSGCGNSDPKSYDSGCACKDDNPHMRHMPIGMAYVPMQKWGEMYAPEKALCEGTAFPELNLIFCGARGKM